MERLVVKEYRDFEKIVIFLNKDKEVMINLTELNNDLKVRIIDLVTGYVYNKGKLKKERLGEYLVSIN